MGANEREARERVSKAPPHLRVGQLDGRVKYGPDHILCARGSGQGPVVSVEAGEVFRKHGQEVEALEHGVLP